MTRPYRVFRHYIQSRSVLLLAGDVFVLFVTASLDDLLRLGGVAAPWSDGLNSLFAVVAFVLFGISSLFLAGLYEIAPQQSRHEVAVRAVGAGTIWVFLYLAFGLSTPTPEWVWWGGFPPVALATLGAVCLRFAFAILVRTPPFRERVLFLGATSTADRLVNELETNHPGYEILGYVDDRPEDQVAITNGFRVLGATRELCEIATGYGAGTIVVCLTERRGTFPLRPILDCKLLGIRIEDWPAFYEKLTGKIVVQNLRPSWLVFSEGFHRALATRAAKRVIDLLLASIFLVLGWPVLFLVALAIRLDSPGPILFRQERVGERGRPFTLLKFRTMKNDAEAETGPVWAIEDDPRITRVGYWLRKTRLDELPQIWNVFKGEMSFIGPRPERPHFVAQLQKKIPYYAERHSVKPGITGWAQVRYPYGSTIQDSEEKLQYDLYYVKNMSGLLDIDILFSTIRVVLFGKGAR
ncbi:MAG: TIGR03013 family PEP-CTERM/XrtA system glycosyltransferase [Zetaproteobacteria bacterium]|nr:MAG: TIGR03013 family PEP-CTERM/XrtA system glycosyltransferase [Zetaproteobacteria bacterium]